jgi:hypothetical protein
MIIRNCNRSHSHSPHSCRRHTGGSPSSIRLWRKGTVHWHPDNPHIAHILHQNSTPRPPSSPALSFALVDPPLPQGACSSLHPCEDPRSHISRRNSMTKSFSTLRELLTISDGISELIPEANCSPENLVGSCSCELSEIGYKGSFSVSYLRHGRG